MLWQMCTCGAFNQGAFHRTSTSKRYQGFLNFRPCAWQVSKVSHQRMLFKNANPMLVVKFGLKWIVQDACYQPAGRGDKKTNRNSWLSCQFVLCSLPFICQLASKYNCANHYMHVKNSNRMRTPQNLKPTLPILNAPWAFKSEKNLFHSHRSLFMIDMARILSLHC